MPRPLEKGQGHEILATVEQQLWARVAAHPFLFQAARSFTSPSILHLRRQIFPNGVDGPKPPAALLALSTQRATIDQALGV